ncbi:hypothetical protein CC86DRAFT_160452 [Ophiobolus disseminans]|uniref:HECT-type E3 ubiquitin transferase n=1 Tax=Ophiobolus disseminans TaxID=1469910 RepID=A0A6A7ABW8_9PLEO|nr:hypothetical protein CC86DRAFT_160452 [Ophiobolus disseminans]
MSARDAPRSPASLSSEAEHAEPQRSRKIKNDALGWSRNPSLHNVIDVDDASRVLECSQVERQLRVQHVVRHYLSQILHGCRSAYCDTPTCLSAQERAASRPIRPPTQLTARALAHYLAGQDSPRRGLCPHELKVSPASLEIDGAIGTRLQQGHTHSGQYSVYPAAWTLVQHASGRLQAHGEECARDHVHALSTSLVEQRVVAAVGERHQKRKDTKSLSQNLFDSVTMIYAYSKQLPSPASILGTLRSASTSTTNAEPQSRTQHVTSTSHANDPDDTPHVKRQPHMDRQHSQRNQRARSHGQVSASSAEVLSNGQQVHRIPLPFRDFTSAIKSPKTTTQSALDGTFDLPKLSIAKTGKKNLILDSTAPDMGRISPPSARPNQIATASKPPLHPDPALPILSELNCNTLETLKDDVYDHRKHRALNDFNFSIDYDTNGRFRPSKPFVNRSLFYNFSDPETLLKSFHDRNIAFEKSPLPHLDSAHLTHSFRDWNRRNGALIFDSLWIALEALYTPPPEICSQKSPRLRPSRKSTSRCSSTEQLPGDDSNASKPHRYLSNVEAAHIVMVCIHALTSLISVGWPHTWTRLRKLRSWGIVMPIAAPDTDEYTHPYLNIVDELEYEPAIRLAERLLGALGARTCFEHILATIKKQEVHQEASDNEDCDDSLVDMVVQHLKVVERVALASKRRMTPNSSSASEDPGWTVTATLVEWLKTIITKKWDSKVQMNKWSSVGSAVMLLDKLYPDYKPLNLRETMFEIPFFNERLDTLEEPLKFLTWGEQPNTLHILQYPMLFPAEYLVRYFRTINFTSMMSQYDHTTRTHQMQRSLEMFLREPHLWLIKSRMKITLSDYLVLNVSREDPLKDTLDQLWGLEKRMLLKPLKVKMGQHEGEFGADHGGVTYEFFRVVLSEAFKPDHGMFTLDSETRVTWFQPNTLEPDWKFEMIGELFSLAVYNGVTLPVTFPLALYRFLLPAEAPLRNRDMSQGGLDHIKDGWPELAKGFEQLLEWTEGDVAELFMRDYAFSYQAFGQHVDHNMDEPYARPQQATQQSQAIRPEDLLNVKTREAKLITNENRIEFVRDYVHHLTYLSVSPQLHAFRKGFLACLAPKSLHFFSPLSLRKLIEGEQHISIPDLRSCARYDEAYSATHPTIQMFWRAVEQYNQEDRRRLLEFVTASDRVPVTGYEAITFHIARASDAEMLPTSSTCFGKLYLPQYEDEEVMRRNLELAIKNSKGFGIV